MPSDGFTVKEYLRDMDQRHETRFKSIEDAIKDATRQITERQDKTNGRVKALEMWRSALVGGMAIITFLGAPNVIGVLANSV